MARGGGEGERVRTGSGFREGVGTDRAGGQERQVFRLLTLGAPADEGIVHDGVLHIDNDARGGVDSRNFFDGKHALEEITALAAVRLGDFDGHEAEFEELADQILVEDGGMIHFADEGRDAVAGELANRVAEEKFVGVEVGQRGHGKRAGKLPSSQPSV